MGHFVENLLWEDLRKPYKMRMFSMKKYNKSSTTNSEPMILNVGKCECVEEIILDKASLGEKVFNAGPSVVARMEKNAPLIDFAGPGRNVYQVTVRRDHSFSLKGLKKLFLASGHIIDKDGTLVESENAAQIGNISYFWVIPEERESDWKKKAPKSKTKEKFVASCVRKYVNQYILVMDRKPIESNLAS